MSECLNAVGDFEWPFCIAEELCDGGRSYGVGRWRGSMY